LRATRIVFILISILVFAPIIVLCIRSIWRKWKNKQKKTMWVSTVLAMVLCVLMVLFMFTLYQFTIGYQAPLVAERMHSLFIHRVEEKITMEQYKQSLLGADLVDIGFRPINDIDLEQAEFEGEGYSISLSERVYDNTDSTVTIYALYGRGSQRIYTETYLKLYGNQWKAIEHRMVTEEKIQSISGISFYEIKF
jgi:amino acid transporter